jgi:hypothetical protein
MSVTVTVARQVYGTTLLAQARDHLGALEPVASDLPSRLEGCQPGLGDQGCWPSRPLTARWS